MAQFDINVVVKTQQAVAGIQNVNKSLGNIEKSIQRVQRLLGAAFAFQAVASGIQSITNLSDTLLQAENRIRSVGIEGQNLTQTTAALFGVANQTRQAFSTTAEVFARTAASLKVLGLNEQEALALTTSLNQAVALSGSTTQEASNALIQFSQGLASGTLRGDELRSVLEQIPVVADVIAKQLGVTRNELRGLAKDGTITPAVIVQAFRAARVELGERFAKLIPTISQSFVVLNNRAIEVGGGFLKTSGIAQTLSKAILFLADNMETVLRVAGGLATVIGTVLAGAFVSFVASIAAATGPFGVLVAGLAAGAVALVGFGDQIKVTNDGVVSFFDVAKAVFEDFRQLVSDAFANVGSAVDPRRYRPGVPGGEGRTRGALRETYTDDLAVVRRSEQQSHRGRWWIPENIWYRTDSVQGHPVPGRQHGNRPARGWRSRNGHRDRARGRVRVLRGIDRGGNRAIRCARRWSGRWRRRARRLRRPDQGHERRRRFVFRRGKGRVRGLPPACLRRIRQCGISRRPGSRRAHEFRHHCHRRLRRSHRHNRRFFSRLSTNHIRRVLGSRRAHSPRHKRAGWILADGRKRRARGGGRPRRPRRRICRGVLRHRRRVQQLRTYHPGRVRL